MDEDFDNTRDEGFQDDFAGGGDDLAQDDSFGDVNASSDSFPPRTNNPSPGMDDTMSSEDDGEVPTGMTGNFGNSSTTKLTALDREPSLAPKSSDEDGMGRRKSSMGTSSIGRGPSRADLANMGLPQDVLELFEYVDRFVPEVPDIATPLRPFLPDYVPSVGDIDPFLKVPAPGDFDLNLGLKVLDEPATKQSDPTVLDLQLRAQTKQSGLQPMVVRSIDSAAKNPKAVTSWISNVTELHRSKPPTEVHYSKPMPDVDLLMQEWPAALEELIDRTGLPEAELDVSTQEYAEICCALLDIPVHGGKVVESLHVLFSLYSAFKNNQHFAAAAGAEDDGAGAVPNMGSAPNSRPSTSASVEGVAARMA